MSCPDENIKHTERACTRYLAYVPLPFDSLSYFRYNRLVQKF